MYGCIGDLIVMGVWGRRHLVHQVREVQETRAAAAQWAPASALTAPHTWPQLGGKPDVAGPHVCSFTCSFCGSMCGSTSGLL